MKDNAGQIEYWNGAVGETWVRMQERMDRALTPVTTALLSLAAPQHGDHVLDVGCGAGETTLALSAAVGDDGLAIGIDISEPLLDRARLRAKELLSGADFRPADAATFADEADGFDLIISRFGVMFFADPVAAFSNLYRLCVSGGRLCFVCWQSASENLWATLPMQLLGDMIPAEPRYDPHAPGPFAFADPVRVASILEQAGWQNIDFRACTFGMVTGDGDDPIAAAVNFALRIGPAARAIRDAGPAVATDAKALLSEAFASHLKDGEVALPAAVWLVTADA